MRRIRPLILVTALLPMLLGGCSGYRAPTIEITGFSVGEVGPDAVQLVFDLTVINPNVRPLELDEFSYTLSVEGVEVYAGRRAAGANLTALSQRRVSVPTVIPTGAARGGERTCVLRGWLRYRTPGQIAQRFFDTGVRQPKTHFRFEGRVELPQPSQPAQAPPAS